MTRQEQIIEAAKQEEKKLGFAQIVKEMKGVNSAYGIGFLEGAKWADEHSVEEKDIYEQCVQYDSIKAGIQAHAETYSFNIESKLFNQLTKEQQILWRKEIEQAVISGGECGIGLARDSRYKENIELKEVDLEKEAELIANDIMINVQANRYNTVVYNTKRCDFNHSHLMLAARKGIELGIKTQQGKA